MDFFSIDLPVNLKTLLKQMVVMIMIVIVVHVLSMVELLYVHVTLVILGVPAQIMCVMDKVVVGLGLVKWIRMIRKATVAIAILDIQGQIVHQTIAKVTLAMTEHVLLLLVLLRVHVMPVILVILARITCAMAKLAVAMVTVSLIPTMRPVTNAIVIPVILEVIAPEGFHLLLICRKLYQV